MSTKNPERRKSRRMAKEQTIKKIAAVKFSPIRCDFAQAVSNADLGKKMPDIRIALSICAMSKRDMIGMVFESDGNDILKDGGVIKSLLDRLCETRDNFKAFSEICDEAVRRLLIAEHAAYVRMNTAEAAR